MVRRTRSKQPAETRAALDIGLSANRSRLNPGRLRRSRRGCRWELKLLVNEILGNELPQEELISGRQYVKGKVRRQFHGGVDLPREFALQKTNRRRAGVRTSQRTCM